VTKWGLSDKLGPLSYAEEEGEVFLGRSVTKHKEVSDETSHLIDEEVRSLIDQNYERSAAILGENRDKLDRMAEALIRYETIDQGQIKDIMEGRTPRPPEDWSDSDEEDDDGVSVDITTNSSAANDEDDSTDPDPIGGPANQS
jgi:cell division protease FtsH